MVSYGIGFPCSIIGTYVVSKFGLKIALYIGGILTFVGGCLFQNHITINFIDSKPWVRYDLVVSMNLMVQDDIPQYLAVLLD